MKANWQSDLINKMVDMKTIEVAIEEKTFDKKERTIKHWISRSTLDRGKDIVLPKALDETNYRKNPIVLFNHDVYYPIANNRWINSENDGALALTAFGTTMFADDIYTLNVERILNGWSVGFIPKTWEFDEENRVTKFSLVDLLEYSSVSLPMNQDAVTEGLKMVKSFEAQQALTKQIESIEIMKRLEEYDRRFEDMQKLLKEREENAYIEDLEKAEKRILEIDNELKEIKRQLSVGTLGKFSAKEVATSISKKLSGDVS